MITASFWKIEPIGPFVQSSSYQEMCVVWSLWLCIPNVGTIILKQPNPGFTLFTRPGLASTCFPYLHNLFVNWLGSEHTRVPNLANNSKYHYSNPTKPHHAQNPPQPLPHSFYSRPAPKQYWDPQANWLEIGWVVNTIVPSHLHIPS
jgi:hypothetical protein